jgi:hypothetical protein
MVAGDRGPTHGVGEEITQCAVAGELHDRALRRCVLTHVQRARRPRVHSSALERLQLCVERVGDQRVCEPHPFRRFDREHQP